MDVLVNTKISKLEDFVGNYDQKKKFVEFLKNKDNMFAIIVGANGVGKTTFVKLGLDQYGYSYIRPDFDTFTNHKEFTNYISNFVNTRCISFNTSLDKNEKKLIFIDDINILIMQNRYGLSYIEELFTKLKTIKVIVTVNIEDEKKLTDLKKNAHTFIKLQNPPLNECVNFILNALETNGYEVDEEMLIDLIKTYNCNIRSIFKNLESDESLSQEHEVYQDKNIFDIVSMLFKRCDKNINDVQLGISSDPTLISLIMYDNYKDYYYNNYKFNKKNMDYNFNFINRVFIDCSIIESNAYKNNDVLLIDWANLIKCSSIRFFFNTCMKKANNKPNMLKYTTILSRLTQYFSNVKKYNKYNGECDMNYSNSKVLWNMNCISKEKNKSKKGIPKGECTVFFNAYSKIM